MKQHRWIPRVADIVQNIITTKSSRFDPTVGAVMNEYLQKFQAPTRSLVLPPNPNPPHKSRIFSNNYLNLGDVDVVGFDLDYTLIPYTVELQNLIFALAREILVDDFHYPKELKRCFFDPKFAVRGLSVDSRNGVLVKLSHVQKVGLKYSYKGKRPLTTAELDEYYGGFRHVSRGELDKLKPLNDLFALAEACLIADVIDIFEQIKTTTGQNYHPESIINDVQAAIRDVHVSGLMHNTVIKDLDVYCHASPHLPKLLENMRKAGKKLFLCTNSGFRYTDEAMSFALGIQPLSKCTGIRDTDWRDLFDVVMVNAQKPDFFNSKKPFRLWNTESDQLSFSPVGSTLSPRTILAQGSAQALMHITGWEQKTILFVGDNLRADLVEARRWHGWHTACVINELDRELEVQASPLFWELHFLRSTLRHFLTDLQLTMTRTKGDDCVKFFDFDEAEIILELETELRHINSELSCLFNPQFGSIFRTDGHTSLYAFAVRRYADIYMSDVCNLLHYSTDHRFYPAHAMHMAHDPRSNTNE